MSSYPLRLARPLVMWVGMMCAASAAAEVTVDVDLGHSFASASDYERSTFSRASLGYRSDQWLGRAGFARLGQFELEGSGGSTHLDAEGAFVILSRTLKTDWVDWDLGLGAAHAESVAILQGYEIQRESNWEPLAELAMYKRLGEDWDLKGSYIYYHDVVGSAISSVAVGFRWSF